MTTRLRYRISQTVEAVSAQDRVVKAIFGEAHERLPLGNLNKFRSCTRAISRKHNCKRLYRHICCVHTGFGRSHMSDVSFGCVSYNIAQKYVVRKIANDVNRSIFKAHGSRDWPNKTVNN